MLAAGLRKTVRFNNLNTMGQMVTGHSSILGNEPCHFAKPRLEGGLMLGGTVQLVCIYAVKMQHEVMDLKLQKHLNGCEKNPFRRSASLFSPLASIPHSTSLN
jgi:hypothetical protein